MTIARLFWTILPVPPILRPALLSPRPLEPFVVLLALGAELVDEFGIGLERLAERDGERLRVDLRIVDRHLDVHRAEVLAVEFLRHLRGVAHRAAPGVGPQIVAEPSGLDDERVAFPVA